MTRDEQIAALDQEWRTNPRWSNVTRGYSAADVVRLRGSIQPENTLARMGADKLWAGDAAGQGGYRGDLPVRLAGGRGWQHLGNHVSGPVALRLRFRAGNGAPDKQHVSPRRRNTVEPRHQSRRRQPHRLLSADRGRRRGRRSRSAGTWAARCCCRPRNRYRS